MKNYVVIVSDNNGHICNLYLEKDIWKAAEYAVQECVNNSQLTKYEPIEIVEKLNMHESYSENKMEINSGSEFFITIWQK